MPVFRANYRLSRHPHGSFKNPSTIVIQPMVNEPPNGPTQEKEAVFPCAEVGSELGPLKVGIYPTVNIYPWIQQLLATSANTHTQLGQTKWHAALKSEEHSKLKSSRKGPQASSCRNEAAKKILMYAHKMPPSKPTIIKLLLLPAEPQCTQMGQSGVDVARFPAQGGL